MNLPVIYHQEALRRVLSELPVYAVLLRGDREGYAVTETGRITEPNQLDNRPALVAHGRVFVWGAYTTTATPVAEGVCLLMACECPCGRLSAAQVACAVTAWQKLINDHVTEILRERRISAVEAGDDRLAAELAEEQGQHLTGRQFPGGRIPADDLVELRDTLRGEAEIELRDAKRDALIQQHLAATAAQFEQERAALSSARMSRHAQDKAAGLPDRKHLAERFDCDETNLWLLAEESGEVVRSCGKIGRWGYDHVHQVTGESGMRLLEAEVGDFLAIVEIMIARGHFTRDGIHAAVHAKLERLEDWYEAPWTPDDQEPAIRPDELAAELARTLAISQGRKPGSCAPKLLNKDELRQALVTAIDRKVAAETLKANTDEFIRKPYVTGKRFTGIDWGAAHGDSLRVARLPRPARTLPLAEIAALAGQDLPPGRFVTMEATAQGRIRVVMEEADGCRGYVHRENGSWKCDTVLPFPTLC